MKSRRFGDHSVTMHPFFKAVFKIYSRSDKTLFPLKNIPSTENNKKQTKTSWPCVRVCYVKTIKFQITEASTHLLFYTYWRAAGRRQA